MAPIPNVLHLRFSTNLNNGSAVGGMPVDVIIPGAAEVLEQICCTVISHRRRQRESRQVRGEVPSCSRVRSLAECNRPAPSRTLLQL